jgi:hypothetical protein
MYGTEEVHRILAGKLLRRPRHRWEGTFKMELKKIILEVVDWIFWLRRMTVGVPL